MCLHLSRLGHRVVAVDNLARRQWDVEGGSCSLVPIASMEQRVARWWAAAALATLWVLEAGAEAQRLEIPATRAHAGAEGPEVTSLFALGLVCLADQLGRGAVRRLRRLPQPHWPAGDEEGPPAHERKRIAEHLKIPL